MNYEQAVKTLREFKALCKHKALSDSFLNEAGLETRENIGIGGDYAYGIVLMPDELVLSIVNAIYEHFNGNAERPWDSGASVNVAGE
jgi:hypothetical protein